MAECMDVGFLRQPRAWDGSWPLMVLLRCGINLTTTLEVDKAAASIDAMCMDDDMCIGRNRQDGWCFPVILNRGPETRRNMCIGRTRARVTMNIFHYF